MALFDTPEEVRARIGKTGREQDLNLANASGTQLANFGGAQAGRMFAQGLGAAAGYENPEITRARTIQGITSQIDPSNPYQGMLDGAKQLQAQGFTQEAFKFLGAAQKFAPSKTDKGSPFAVQEYKFWSSLDKKEKEDFLRIKRADKVVDVGGVPSMMIDGKPVPLSTIEAEAGAEGKKKAAKDLAAARVTWKLGAPKRALNLRNITKSVDVVTNKADDAIKLLGLNTGGLTGAFLGKIPGRDAFNLAKTLETIKANLGFDRLQQMREASQTGGALGQVAVQELVALQASVASLDPNQSNELIEANLNEVKTLYAAWKKSAQNAAVLDPFKSPDKAAVAPTNDGWSIKEK